MQSEVLDMRKQYHRDKEQLKRATKQHKDHAMHSERTLETVGTQLEEAVSSTAWRDGHADKEAMLHVAQCMAGSGSTVHGRQ